MPRSLLIASIKGTAIRLHWTFLLLFTAIAIIAALSGGVAMAVDVVFLIALIFASVVLHEFGHITVARKFGIETPEVLLLPIGGLAKLKHMPEDPKQELAIAAAGPAVSIALFLILVAVMGRWPEWNAFADLSQGRIRFIEQLAIFNLVVGVFNLLPAFPMDGGRILRALMAFAMPHQTATRYATFIGQTLAIGLGMLALLTGNILLAVIAVFIFVSASSEARIGRMRNTLGGMSAAQVMVTGQARLQASDPIEKAAEMILRSDNEEFPVLRADGSLAGFVLRPDILDSLSNPGKAATAGDIMRRDIPVVSPHFRADKVAQMITEGTPIVGVVSDDGHFAGLVNWRNLLDAMAVNEALKHQYDERQSRLPF